MLRNWEQIKAGERARRSRAARSHRTGRPKQRPAPASPRSLPALAYAQEMQERAAYIGYDWPAIEGVLDKVTEEARRAHRGQQRRAERREEFGDLLMVLVNLGRKLGIDAEAALRGASAKFGAASRTSSAWPPSGRGAARP